MKLVEQMDEPELPSPMFACGHEPVGIRVTAYHKTNGIQQVLNVLEADEIEVLKKSSFGKFISLADKGPFSGRFCRFLMSRQLKVSKKHEAWFLSAGQPIRFSLREFAIVTGLPCGKYPEKQKCRINGKKTLRNLINEKSNWDNLFGKLNQVSVESVLGMLKNKTVTDKEIRVKYACLALLASVLLPTTHFHKIDRAHVECIRDLGHFFAYPWGRVAFDLIMSSIKDRDEVSLSQKTVAIKGFVYALQMVIMEDVPRLTEDIKIADGLQADSEEDGDGTTDDEGNERNEEQVTFSPGHARTVNRESNVFVRSIIERSDGLCIDESEFIWGDEVDDVKVGNLIYLINKKQKFSREMFVGGATKADVERMKEEAKANKQKRKEEIRRRGRSNNIQGKYKDPGVDGCVNFALEIHFEDLATKVANKVKADLSEQLDEAFAEIAKIKALVRNMRTYVCKEVKLNIQEMEGNIIRGVGSIVCHGKKLDAYEKGDGSKETMELDKVKIVRPAVSVKQYGNEQRFCGSSVGVGVPAHRGEKRRYVNDEKIDCAAGNDGRVSNVLVCAPNFSLGLSDDESEYEGSSRHCDSHEDPSFKDAWKLCNLNSVFNGVSKRKRTSCSAKVPSSFTPQIPSADSVPDQRMILRGGVVNYKAKFNRLKEKLTNTSFWISVGHTAIRSDEFLQLIERRTNLTPNIMDVLMSLTNAIYRNQRFPLVPDDVILLDTTVVTLLSRSYATFKRYNSKAAHVFEPDVISTIQAAARFAKYANRYYFPFNFDRKHWVGVCVDIGARVVYVFDSDMSLRSSTTISREMQPISQMFPFLHHQICERRDNLECGSYDVRRLKCVPQNVRATDSGVTAVLQMQAHSIAGPEASARITPDVIEQEIERLSVLMYEHNGGVLY